MRQQNFADGSFGKFRKKTRKGLIMGARSLLSQGGIYVMRLNRFTRRKNVRP